MKRNYNNPVINVKRFNNEILLTISGADTTAASANDKALEALNQTGVNHTLILKY